MILTHIDLKYVSRIYRKIHQKGQNGKGLNIVEFKVNELHQAKRGLMVILKNYVRYISAFDYYKGLY